MTSFIFFRLLPSITETVLGAGICYVDFIGIWIDCYVSRMNTHLCCIPNNTICFAIYNRNSIGAGICYVDLVCLIIKCYMSIYSFYVLHNFIFISIYNRQSIRLGICYVNLCVVGFTRTMYCGSSPTWIYFKGEDQCQECRIYFVCTPAIP